LIIVSPSTRSILFLDSRRAGADASVHPEANKFNTATAFVWAALASFCQQRRRSMKKFFTIAVLATGLAATPALADCAGDMGKITEAMKTAQLDEANTAKAKELWDKAAAAQTASDWDACTAATKELMPIVGVNAG
jgi:hypothetical protein